MLFGLSLLARGQRSPHDVPMSKNTTGGQFVDLSETWTHGEVSGGGLELDGSRRTVAL